MQDVILLVKNINQGSKMVRSLFDTHPEVAVIRQDLDQEIFSLIYKKNSKFNCAYFLDEFFSKFYHAPFISPNSIKSTFRNYTYLDSSLTDIKNKMLDFEVYRSQVKEITHELLAKNDCKNFIDFIRILGIAQHKVEYPEATPKVVLFHLHFMLTDLKLKWPPQKQRPYSGGEFLYLLSELKIKLIFLTRDPLALYSSGVYSKNHGGRRVDRCIEEVILEYSHSYRVWKEVLPDKNFFLLRNEDVHINTKKTLMDLTKFMKVSFLPTEMMQLTHMGLPWFGNSTFGKINNFDPDLTSNKKARDLLSATEIKLLEKICYDQMCDFGYVITQKISGSKFFSCLGYAIKLSKQGNGSYSLLHRIRVLRGLFLAIYRLKFSRILRSDARSVNELRTNQQV